MLVAAKSASTVQDESADEAWVRTADGERSVRLRSLSQYIKKGGLLTEVRLLEGADGLWTIWFRLSDRPGEFRLNQFDYDQPKTYKDVALAIATIREDFGFFGSIALSTERRGR
jgi:hypothetical protein